MTVDHLRRVATRLQPDDDTTVIEDLTLEELYHVLCSFLGTEYGSNAGNDYKIRRENLKRIHRAVGGRPPTEHGSNDPNA